MRVPLTLTSTALVLVNLVPIFGVVVLGWSVGEIVALYWAENLVIGLLNIPRILSAGGLPVATPWWHQVLGRMFLVGFFVIHYGMFTLIHGIFVAALFFGTEGQPLQTNAMGLMADMGFEGGMWLALAGLLASHTLSLAINWFGRREYRASSVHERMGMVYARIVVLHLTILLGGLGAKMLGAPLFALLFLIGLKTVIDLWAHRREHQKAAERA